MESLVIGAGCFWCVEDMFKSLRGVSEVESGYAGGDVEKPTYREVCSGATGAAEVVKITFDPSEVTRADLLRVFFTVHDPTTLNQQGPDIGSQYRSAIFVESEEERDLAQSIIHEITAEQIWANLIVTTIEPLTNYSRAEDYHQGYVEKFENASMLEKLSMNAGYCTAVVIPKVLKFRKQYADRLKDSTRH